MKGKTNSAVFFSCLVINTLDPDSEPDPDSLEMLDPDPQHWYLNWRSVQYEYLTVVAFIRKRIICTNFFLPIFMPFSKE
jgi:hypothetical protein